MSVEHSPVDPSAEPPEKAEEAALRPGVLAEFGGQQRVADQPFADVHLGVGQQVPRLNENPNDAGDQTTHSK